MTYNLMNEDHEASLDGANRSQVFIVATWASAQFHSWCCVFTKQQNPCSSSTLIVSDGGKSQD